MLHFFFDKIICETNELKKKSVVIWKNKIVTAF